tara:strand:- start:988 stop:2001 length:1014 start_codon:yes stop_codon:yes gene_type:complete
MKIKRNAKYKRKQTKGKTKKKTNKKGGSKSQTIKRPRSRLKSKRSSKKSRSKKKAFMKKDRCSPKKKGETLEFSCYTKDSLMKLRDMWNTKHPDTQINTDEPKHIWEALSYSMKNICDKESCWLSNNVINENIDRDNLEKSFAPTMPEEWKSNPNKWLNNIELSKVMKQWEDKDNTFEFIGPTPIDFDDRISHGECVWEELCKFQLKDEIDRKKEKIGIIFNLDEHNKSGSHWVAVFIDIPLQLIYFFDSYGDKEPRRITRFIKRVQNQAQEMGYKFGYMCNKKRHQYENSECGMYCLYFIINMLKKNSKITFNRLQKNRLNDKHMEKLRKVYFNEI